MLLVECNTHLALEDRGRYTVKKLLSMKSTTNDGWKHNAIELQPLNPEYGRILISNEDAVELRVVGESVTVFE